MTSARALITFAVYFLVSLTGTKFAGHSSRVEYLAVQELVVSLGQHPGTGEQLVRQRAFYECKDADGKSVKTVEYRAGWDATVSAPSPSH